VNYVEFCIEFEYVVNSNWCSTWLGRESLCFMCHLR